MDDLRDEADAEADAVFTAERLRQQQQQILRAARARAAARPASSASRATAGRQHRRSIGARVAPAVARGGRRRRPLRRRRRGLGFFAPDCAFRRSAARAGRRRQRLATVAPRRARRRPAVRVSADRGPMTLDDDAFLLELELALGAAAHARTAALRRADAARARDQRQPGTARRIGSAACLAHLPQGPRPEARRRRHAGRELPQRSSSSRSRPNDFTLRRRPPHGPSRARVRLLLRRRSRRRLRLPDAHSAFPTGASILTGEIIHNPHVNDQLRGDGHPLPERPRRESPSTRSTPTTSSSCRPSASRSRCCSSSIGAGCTLVDTTCGSVLNVWKNVAPLRRGRLHLGHPRQGLARGNAGDGVAGGRSTAAAISSCSTTREAAVVCDYIRDGGDRAAFLARFAQRGRRPASIPIATSQRIGLANQTTMLMSESLEIGEMLKAAMIDRCGDATLAEHYQAFDTICSATQDRQDAVVALLRERPVDLMIVIGGYNSSNTAISPGSAPRRGRPSTSPTPTAWCRATRSGTARSGAKVGGDRDELAAASGPGRRRPDLRRLDAGQPGRRGHRQARGVLRPEAAALDSCLVASATRAQDVDGTADVKSRRDTAP